MQWHPLFAQLLRPLLENYYEVQTNVPVGDAPRQGDVVLVQRTSGGTTPFHGLWRWLSACNVLEFKGPTVSARVEDLDSLLELGLGIERRLNEQRAKDGLKALGRRDLSFWYLANHLGRRFLAAARDLGGQLEELAAGVWRMLVWQRSLMLVSNRAVAVERDGLPVHLLTTEPEATQREVVRLMGADPKLWHSCRSWLAGLRPTLVEEVTRMSRKKGEVPVLDVRPLVKHLGWQEILRQTGLEGLITQVGVENLIDQVGVENLAAKLNDEQRQKLLRLLQQPAPPKGPSGKRRN
jgi:hypothetical protein